MARRKKEIEKNESVSLIRDRVKEFRRVRASELMGNPKNWRKHPGKQRDAMASVLENVGFAGAVLARETDTGLILLDGHLRQGMVDPAMEIPVLVLDVDEAEAEVILATYDPIGSLAKTDKESLSKLIESTSVLLGEMNVGSLFIADENSNEPVEQGEQTIKLAKVNIEPPKMAWMLVGVPVGRWGEVAPMAERLAKVNEFIVEITANDYIK